MALILIIETATAYCSVALVKNGVIIASLESDVHNDHAAVLANYIKQVFDQTDNQLKDLHAVAVSKGPGSYTGLRIGVSSAKGLCYSLEIPLIALNTLDGMAYGMINNIVRERSQDFNTLFCPMIDARRMEVYCAVYNKDMELIQGTSAEIIDEHSFESLLNKYQLLFFGDGSQKTMETLGKNPNARIISNFQPSAGYFATLAEQSFKEGKFEDMVYFEPYYLKQFIAGTPKVKGLK